MTRAMTPGCAPSVPFEVKLSLEGLVDRFDDLSQRLEQGCARPFPFTFTGRPQQLDSMLGQFAFETTAEVVLVADESLSGALSQKLAFGCQEVKEGLAFVGLGPGQGEGDGQALKGADQVQAQAPEEAAVAGAVAVFGPTCQVGAFDGLAGAARTRNALTPTSYSSPRW